jgi:RNA polymerase sigma factor (sigma-70 family)
MRSDELIPHLFRTEFRKITSVLIRTLGIRHVEAAEDIASETFLTAMEVWPYKGIPKNPTAWLYTVAKNKTRNYLTRDQLFSVKVSPAIADMAPANVDPVIDLSDQNIRDSQLQMLFAICHPSIPVDSQIGLALRILCGFGIEEIATAFLTSKETINKRLFRAREKLKEGKADIAYPDDDEIENRLETVLTTLYLLFNEGYYSESNDAVVREDLCAEAMRLTHLLVENDNTDTPAVNALFALMCFHSSRFRARKGDGGEVILYEDQDTALWDYDLIARGSHHLKKASTGKQLSKYHLEAAIAYWHTRKEDTPEKWENILQLYNQLLQIAYSPIAALNRTYALSRANGKRFAIAEAEKLQLVDNHYYYTLLADLYNEIDNAKAIENLKRALAIARTSADKKILNDKLTKLKAQ